MTYDGKTSLQKALEQLHGKKLTFDDLSKITNGYRKVLNLPTGKPISKAADKLKIYQWERDAITQSSLIESPPIEPATQIAIDDVLPVTRKRNKIKRDKRFSGFTRISFNVTGNTQRQHISLEPEFIKALELIAPTNSTKWLSETVSNWIATNGVESSTRIVKCSIVNELVSRVVPIVEPVTPELKSDGRCTISSGKNFAYRCKRNEYKNGRCKQHYDIFIKRGY